MSEILSRTANRIKAAIGKSLIDAAADDNEIQLVKISGMDNETQPDIERIQEYGMTSNPPIGSEAVVLYLGGNHDHGIVVKTDSGEFRIQSLKSGEVCVYSKFGQKILLDDNGEIVFNDGTDFMAGFTDLKSGFDQLKADHNALVLAVNTLVLPVIGAVPLVPGVPPVAGPPAPPPAIPSIATIDAAKIEEIKVP